MLMDRGFSEARARESKKDVDMTNRVHDRQPMRLLRAHPERRIDHSRNIAVRHDPTTHESPEKPEAFGFEDDRFAKRWCVPIATAMLRVRIVENVLLF